MTRRPLTSRPVSFALVLAGLVLPAAAQTSGGASETSNPAPAVAAAQTAQGTIELVPPKGPVGEQVRILGSGLTPNAPVVVLAGVDPNALSPMPLDEGEAPQQMDGERPEFVDTSGAFRTIVEVPQAAEYGESFYFALKIGDAVTKPMAYQVDAREPQD